MPILSAVGWRVVYAHGAVQWHGTHENVEECLWLSGWLSVSDLSLSGGDRCAEWSVFIHKTRMLCRSFRSVRRTATAKRMLWRSRHTTSDLAQMPQAIFSGSGDISGTV